MYCQKVGSVSGKVFCIQGGVKQRDVVTPLFFFHGTVESWNTPMQWARCIWQIFGPRDHLCKNFGQIVFDLGAACQNIFFRGGIVFQRTELR